MKLILAVEYIVINLCDIKRKIEKEYNRSKIKQASKFPVNITKTLQKDKLYPLILDKFPNATTLMYFSFKTGLSR